MIKKKEVTVKATEVETEEAAEEEVIDVVVTDVEVIEEKIRAEEMITVTEEREEEEIMETELPTDMMIEDTIGKIKAKIDIKTEVLMTENQDKKVVKEKLEELPVQKINDYLNNEYVFFLC